MKNSARYSYKLLTLLSSAGVSVAPAALLGAASVLLAPATAFANNECVPIGVDPALNGATADSYVCSGASTYAVTGIGYNTAGPLTLTSSGAMSVGPVGINLIGTGADTITYTSSSGVITGTGGPVFDVQTATGAINLTTTGITGTNIAVTYGIAAFSTSGAITIADSGTINVNSSTVGAQQQAAIRAQTSGAINITTTGSVTGRQIGIQATNTGTGAVTINANNAVGLNTTAGVGIAAIDVSAGSGAVNVNVGGTTGTVNGQAGAAIRINSTGAQNVTISTGRTVQATTASVGAINLSGAGAKTISNSGTLSAGATGVAVLASSGSSLTLTNSGALTGRLSLGDITGASTVTNSGTWSTNGLTTFSAGASTLTNSGTLTVQGDSTFAGLETFNNSGTIALGLNTLTVANTAFTGSGSSLITATVSATDAGQLSLPGATTAGVTTVRVSGITDTTLFSDTPIVLVDVTGGTTAAGHFVLDAGSTGFVEDPTLGGVLRSDGSLFGLALRFNGEGQHALVSVPTTNAYEFVPALHEVISTWHTTADLVAGRNAELNSGRNGGMWIRLIGDRTERDFAPSFEAGGNTFDFDSNYQLYTGAAIVGFDVLSGSSNSGDYVMGFHGGLVRTRMEMGNSDTTDDMDGVALGLYGGMNNGPLSFDGTLNANLLNLDHNDPVMGDTSSNVISIGGRGEVGYMWSMSEAFYVQPIVTGAYVRTTIDDMFPKSYEIEYDDVESARAAIGLRLGANAGTGMGPVGFWLTGRLWKEFADEANVSIGSTDATDFVFADDLSGEFEELIGGLTLDAGSARFFLSGGAQFRDEVDNYNASAGVRWRW